MNKTRTIVALGMAALLSLNMSAASMVFPGDSTPAVTLYVHDGDAIVNDFQKGYIPIGMEQADPTQAAVCPAIEKYPATLDEYLKIAVQYDFAVYSAAGGDLAMDPDGIYAWGVMPIEYQLDKFVMPAAVDFNKLALLSVYMFVYDTNGCYVAMYEITPEFAKAIQEPGDQHYTGPAKYDGTVAAAEKPKEVK